MTEDSTPVTLITSLVKTLHAALYAAEPYTAQHSERVGLLSFEAAVGQVLALSPDQCEGLRVAGYLHDIGKIATPVELLVKSGPMLPEETALIRLHPLRGYEILSPFNWPWPIAETALQHHERLDGSGYPYGLLDDQIHPFAKIIAVTDTVEAMVVHRPYRPSRGLNAALDAINEGRGTLYDPTVVDAVIELLTVDGYQLERGIELK
jgi:HD-GYP domain-containing protein (c-di-GMP phosphodiesterase class II)